MTLNKTELYDIADQIQDRIGIECFLDSILKAMSEKELRDMLEYIDRMEDLDIFNSLENGENENEN
jgi:hypothetical protein